MIKTRLILALMLAGGFGSFAVAPTQAAPIDLATACGARFTGQAQHLAASATGIAPFSWLQRARTANAVAVDLLVYFPNAVKRYTGFACGITANGTLVPLGAAAPPGGPTTGH